jgi:hypothetical protein
MISLNGKTKKQVCQWLGQRNKGISIKFESFNFQKFGNVNLPCAASSSSECHLRSRRRCNAWRLLMISCNGNIEKTNGSGCGRSTRILV